MKFKLFIIFMVFILSIGAVSASDDIVGNGTDTDVQLPVEEQQVADQQVENTSSGTFLYLDNDAMNENVKIGEEVTWVITVANFGPEISKNTKVYDELPDGLQYLYHHATKGTFDSQTGIWDIGDLSVEDTAVFLYITCKAITPGEKVNKATLTSDTFNFNPKTYEVEEIDVEDDDYDDDSVKKEIAPILYPAGNPLVLVLISLCSILFLPLVKRQ